MTLDEVHDLEVLRSAAKLLERENQKLVREIVRLRQQLLTIKGGDPKQLTLQLEGLEQQLSNLQRKVFGESSEKRPSSSGGVETEDGAVQRGHGPRPQPELAVIEELHRAEAQDRMCKACGGELAEWAGQFEASEEIDIIERQFVLRKHKRQKYRCNCGQCIETAPGPLKLFDGARYSTDFAIEIAVSKYADHLPLERQVRMMARDGLVVDSQTLWDQLNALARNLEPAHEALHAYILNQPVIGADETHWRLMGEKNKGAGGKGKRWFAWAIVAPDAVSYRLQNSRSAEAAKQVFGEYAGSVLCDGYSAYDSLKKQGARFTIAHCWAHVRRKFVEIEEQNPTTCGQILEKIGQLYGIERELRDASDDERLKRRSTESRAIVEEIRQWALQVDCLPQSPLRKAIEYMGGIWKGLLQFLTNPSIELDNNRVERALRGIVLGRKNHYGSRSQRGTQVAALFYSLIESAKLCEVDPRRYLKLALNSALEGREIPLPHQLS